MSTTRTRYATLSRGKKVAVNLLSLLFLLIAAGAGSLLGGSANPSPATASTTQAERATCVVICAGTVSGSGGNTSPAPSFNGSGGSGGGDR